MQAFLHKKKVWEYHNQRMFFRLVRCSNNATVEIVKAAGLATSFLLYLVYKIVQGMLVVLGSLIAEPPLVRRISPQKPPESYHEFQQHSLELKIKSGGWRS